MAVYQTSYTYSDWLVSVNHFCDLIDVTLVWKMYSHWLFLCVYVCAVMSSPSTVRRFGTAKTYGRTRENAASRAFDEMITGKPAPIKASPAYTKWGKTNFVAIRSDKKTKLECPPEPNEVEMKSEDVFSFDTEDKRRASPTKPKRVVVAPEVQRATTRLPASRIVTQGMKGQCASGTGNTSQDSESSSAAIARPGRTYTRSQEGRMSSGPSSQLIMDQFVEVGKTVKTDSGIEVVYSIEPHEPKATSQTPAKHVSATPPSLPERSPKKFPAESSSSSLDTTPKSSKPSSVFDDDEDDDFFPITFRRTPLKTYTGEIITPISDAPDDPPPKKRKKGPTGLPRGRKPSRYTDPSLIEEYRRRYEETHGKKEPTAGMFNSTVISSKELKGSQGTTLVVVCKPKVELSQKKDDVQTKYFKNVKKELGKSEKHLEVATESNSQEGASAAPSAGAEPASTSTTPSPSIRKSPASSQDNTGSTVSTPTRMLRVRFADEETDSPVSSASSRSTLSPVKQLPRGAAIRSRDKPPMSSSQGSAVSVTSDSSASEASVAKRTRSGGKQYRIFKSRGPPQPAPTEPEKEEEDVSGANSPPMPELTREVPESSDSEESQRKGQNPPNITDEEETGTTAEPSQAYREDATPVTDSQVSQLSSSEGASERTEEPVEDSSSPQPQVRPSDSQDTPSPASDDSQELSQEIPSSTESSQKEESAPAAPRRFFKSKKSSSASSLQRKVFEKVNVVLKHGVPQTVLITMRSGLCRFILTIKFKLNYSVYLLTKSFCSKAVRWTPVGTWKSFDYWSVCSFFSVLVQDN